MVKHSNKNGVLELCTSQTAVTSISARCYLPPPPKRPGQISFFIPNSTNRQTWRCTLTFEKVKLRGNIIKRTMGSMCHVISVRKALIPNRCVLRIPGMNYMCKLWRDFTPILMDQIPHVTSTHKCHINTVSFSMVMELRTLHIMLYLYARYQACVFMKSRISADMQFGTWMKFLDLRVGCGGTPNSLSGLLCLILL
jgi:hypothetical protein